MSGANMRVVIDDVSVMVAYFDMLCMRIVHPCRRIPLRQYPSAWCRIHTHTQQVKICCHNTDNINNDTHIGTRHVILAKHWMWLPDDGLCEWKHVGADFIILTILIISGFYNLYALVGRVVGPCHHGMARPQVADRGTAPKMEGSCE